MVRIKRNSHNLDSFNLLQFVFGLFRNVLNTYNLKALVGPNITLAKMISSGFFGIFSETIFHVLQADSTNYKPPSPKKRRQNSVESGTLIHIIN